ncbi:LytTR family DNA-binding domain-containing protein [Shewanella sp. PP-He15 brown]
MLKAIIVEDSRLARVELNELLKVHPEIEVIAEAVEAEEAIHLINELKPDVVFLDIHLPQKDGFSILEAVDSLPLVIFTTAFDKYAVKSFEYNTLDYLLKPINKQRLAKAIDKLVLAANKSINSEPDRPPLTPDKRVFVRDGEQCWLLNLDEVRLFESCGNYTQVHFGTNRPMIFKSLNKIETRLDINYFFRANRRHIINLKFVKSIEPWMNGNFRLLMDDDTEIETSRRNTKKFKNLLSL